MRCALLYRRERKRRATVVCSSILSTGKFYDVHQTLLGIPTGEHNAAVLNVSLLPTSASATLQVQKSSSIRVIGKTRSPVGLSYSPSGSWLVAVGGHKSYVCRTSDLKAGFTKLVSPDKLTCLAFHPTEDFFATGDTKGVVRLWYCLNDSIPVNAVGVEKTAPTTTLHWHAHSVASLAFTANGAYLLSGGEEAVLVIWQLHTGKKEFVPRVGAPISSVTLSTSRSREEEYLLGLSDASFVFVRSATLQISRTITKVKLGAFAGLISCLSQAEAISRPCCIPRSADHIHGCSSRNSFYLLFPHSAVVTSIHPPDLFATDCDPHFGVGSHPYKPCIAT